MTAFCKVAKQIMNIYFDMFKIICSKFNCLYQKLFSKWNFFIFLILLKFELIHLSTLIIYIYIYIYDPRKNKNKDEFLKLTEKTLSNKWTKQFWSIKLAPLYKNKKKWIKNDATKIKSIKDGDFIVGNLFWLS